MPVETKEAKAHRLLTEGRLLIEEAQPGGKVIASCRGLSEGEVYHLGWDDQRREFRCTCQANRDFHRECSHLVALKLVVARSKR